MHKLSRKEFYLACRKAEEEVERLSNKLDITNADHIALWLRANWSPDDLGWIACRIVEAHEAIVKQIQSARGK